MLMALDATDGRGLTLEQIRTVLVRCGGCSRFMTKYTHRRFHQCATLVESDIIDLTGDDE